MPISSTDPTRSGLSTSEGKLALVAFVVGTAMEGAIIPLLQQLQASHPTAAWVGPVMVVAGLLLQITSLFGYTYSRTALKRAILAQDNPAPIYNLHGLPPGPSGAASAAGAATTPPRS